MWWPFSSSKQRDDTSVTLVQHRCDTSVEPPDTSATPVSDQIDSGATPVPDPDPPRVDPGNAREHAAMLVQALRAIWPRPVELDDLELTYLELCEELGWTALGWIAIARELAKLPGVRRSKPWRNGRRLTVYVIAPAAETVVDLAA